MAETTNLSTGTATSLPPKGPDGLAIGRVVHYTSSTGQVVGGRISHVYDPSGIVHIHLDTVPGVHKGLGPDAEKVAYDPSGKPGTWRYPPRA